MREIHQAGEMANNKHYWQDTIKTALAVRTQRRKRETQQIAELPDEGKEVRGEPWGWEAAEGTIEEQLRRLGEAVDEWRCPRPLPGQQETPRVDTDSTRNPVQEMVSWTLQATQEMGRLLEGVRLQALDPVRWREEEVHRPRRVEEVRTLTNRATRAIVRGLVAERQASERAALGQRARQPAAAPRRA